MTNPAAEVLKGLCRTQLFTAPSVSNSLKVGFQEDILEAKERQRRKNIISMASDTPVSFRGPGIRVSGGTGRSRKPQNRMKITSARLN